MQLVSEAIFLFCGWKKYEKFAVIKKVGGDLRSLLQEKENFLKLVNKKINDHFINDVFEKKRKKHVTKLANVVVLKPQNAL